MRTWIWMAVGIVLVVGGAALLAGSGSAAGQGWSAYAPLTAGPMIDFGNGSVLLTRAQQTSWGLIAAGLIVVAGALGYRLGRRR